VHKYGKAMGIIAVPIYGGSPMETQLRQLKRGVDVVVATPGRALDHIRRKSLRLAGIKVVILDKADEGLDIGFAEDLEAILKETPKERETALPRSRTGTSRTQVGSASTVRWFPRVQLPACARSPPWWAARTRWPRSAACSTPLTPHRPSSFAAPAPRSTSSPSR